MGVDIKNKAIQIVLDEVKTWEDATVYVTENVAFEMRNLIKSLKKNYWGIFDQPLDPMSGRKKIWVPLTETMVESVVKNIDLDTKDINFRAKNTSAIGLTSVIRSLVKNNLDEITFGQKLDEFERQLATYGTAVWKTIETKEGMDIRNVDLLNIYIDPTARDIQEAYRFTERAVVSVDEIAQMKGWMNTRGLSGEANINRYDSDLNTEGSTEKWRSVYETWGKVPKSIITGKETDNDVEIDGHIVISKGDEDGDTVVHLIEDNKKKLKPYEEAWYTKVDGRWYGKGVAEKVYMLQLWMNTIVNIRINRAYFSQLGIFKIKRGSGITTDMIGKLSANGAILVRDQKDIEQLAMQEASVASYKDEDVVNGWAERVTSAFEVVTGEAMPASTTATMGAIQNRNAMSQFTLIKEGIGFFLQRWLKRHAIPIITKKTNREDLVRTFGDSGELEKMDELVVNKKLMEAVKKAKIVDPAEIEKKKISLTQKYKTFGKDRFIKLLRDPDVTKYDIQVFITNEEMDVQTLSQNLISVLQLAPEYRESVTKQIFDTMGLNSLSLKAQAPVEQEGQQEALTGKQKAVQGAANPQQSQQFANTRQV